MNERECCYCGKLFVFMSPYAMYCSEACRREADKENKRMTYVGKRKERCDYCGKALPKYKTRFCSKECASKSRSGHLELTKTCQYCGKTFITNKNRQRYCSEQCRSIERKKKRDNFIKSITIDNDINLSTLAKRDNNICAICGEKVNWQDKTIVDGHFIAGIRYPSIDHVVPISKGGQHSWDNVQLAHMGCNSMKGSKRYGRIKG